MCEETANQLRQQLKDQQEQNEELEFRLFELEETAEKVQHANVVIQQTWSSLSNIKQQAKYLVPFQ